MDAQADVEVMSPEKIKCAVKDVMQRAALLVKAANDLPRRGDDFELCNSFSTFTAFMEQQETRIRLMLTSLMRNAGCPTRMPKVNSDVDEYLERIVMVNDHVVERAGIVMDELDRGGREDVEIPKTVIGAESVKKRKAEAEAMFQEQVHNSDPGSVLAERLRLTQEEVKFAKVEDLCEKPQKKYGFESSIDNSYNVFIPKLLNKHHALPRKETSGMVIIDEDMGSDGSKREVSINDTTVSHPYLYEIQNFVVPDVQLESKVPTDFLDISKTPLTMVKTVEDLRRLRDVLNSCVEFAVDLEHHDFRSYLGLTCLIQISTRTEDYIIDPFPIWNEMHILNEPFTDAKILKVFHGAEHDIEWLQRDFGIYVVNMFDTGRAMRQLEMQKFNLRYLVHHYCGILLNKKYQLSDWRVRPLDSDMITYARSDTHYLLYCCDRLREDLLKKGDSNQTLLRLVYSGSASICSRVYQKPSFDKDGFHGLERRFVNNRQEAAMQVLWHWRDRMAREEDESVQYILPNHMLIRIAESLPRELKGILHCCNPVPPLVRECVHELHKMILKCRDLPLIECKNEAMDEVTEEVLRRRRMRGKYTKENIFIICPLDFSQTGFDEESGNQMSSSKVDDTSPVSERNPTHTLLSVLDSATVIGNNLNGDFGAYTVVDKSSTINKNAINRILERLQNIGTPYESYTIAANIARKKEAEEKSRCGDQPESLVVPKKLYTHHDAPAERQIPAVKLNVNEGVIVLNDGVETSAMPQFANSQILTKKKLKQARRMNRQNIDIPIEVSAEEGPSYSIKRTRDIDEFEGRDSKLEPFDYSQFDSKIFSQSSVQDGSFDPFNQKHRLENKKNFRRRPRGGHHRMGTMSIGYKPTSRK